MFLYTVNVIVFDDCTLFGTDYKVFFSVSLVPFFRFWRDWPLL